MHYDSNHYSDILFTTPDKLVEAYRDAVAAGQMPDHDTLIGTGVSGSVAVGMLGHASGKLFAVVRKPGDGSHDYHDLVGRVGDRWLFIDDFIASGTTFRRVRSVVAEKVPGAVLVGAWQYTRRNGDGHFEPSYEESRRAQQQQQTVATVPPLQPAWCEPSIKPSISLAW